jgi:hypothetical protein
MFLINFADIFIILSFIQLFNRCRKTDLHSGGSPDGKIYIVTNITLKSHCVGLVWLVYESRGASIGHSISRKSQRFSLGNIRRPRIFTLSKLKEISKKCVRFVSVSVLSLINAGSQPLCSGTLFTRYVSTIVIVKAS